MPTTTPHAAAESRLGRYRRGVAELGRLQKTSRGAPAYSRYVNRWMGRRLAAAAGALDWTPNRVTAVSAAATFSAIALLLLARPTPVVSVAVGLLLVAGYALDAADGQLARLQRSGSAAGEWLDHTVDAIKTSSLHLAVLVSWFRFGDLAEPWLLVPLGFQVVASVSFFTMILTDQLRRSLRGKQGMFLAADGSSSAAYSLAVSPTDYGVLCVVLGLIAWPAVFAPVYGLLFLANAGFLALALPKWYREIRRAVAAQRAAA
jgi:phosphatidylglycerophosphate synthase